MRVKLFVRKVAYDMYNIHAHNYIGFMYVYIYLAKGIHNEECPFKIFQGSCHGDSSASACSNGPPLGACERRESDFWSWSQSRSLSSISEERQWFWNWGSPTHAQRKIDRDYVLDAGSANSHFLFLYTSTVAYWIWLWFDFAEQIQTFQFLFSSVSSCVFLPQLSTNRSQVDICLVWHWVGREILRKRLIVGSWGCRHM